MAPRFSLLPRDSTFFDLFSEAGASSVHSAELLDQLIERWPDAGDLPAQVVAAEHEGDRITHEIIKRLNSTFVTPLDREDIYRVSGGPLSLVRVRNLTKIDRPDLKFPPFVPAMPAALMSKRVSIPASGMYEKCAAIAGRTGE